MEWEYSDFIGSAILTAYVANDNELMIYQINV